MSDRLLITVHGIRTFGKWQEKLGNTLRAEAEDAIEICHYRYGFFTIVAFLLPPLRWLATRRFRLDLLNQTTRAQWSRIDIVAHSFGTHLVAWSLMRLRTAQPPKIHTIILAGSVLKSSFPIRELLRTCVYRVINECGIKDYVLVVNQLAVLFTGMAGRIGLNGMEGGQFRNRYYNFGHSGYFQESSDGATGFMKQYWIPLLLSDDGITTHDERTNKTTNDATAILLNNAEPIKLACYLAPLLLALAYVNGLRIEARREATIAEQRREQAEYAAAREVDARQESERQRDKANRQTAIAEGQTRIANNQKRLADQARHDAETALTQLQRTDQVGVHYFRSILRGHDTPIRSVVMEPSGRSIISIGANGTSRVWNIATGKVEGLINARSDELIAGASFSPDGKFIFTTALSRELDAGRIVIWSLAAGGVQEKGAVAFTGSWNAARVSSDGRFILAAANGKMTIWTWNTNQRKLSLRPRAVLNINERIERAEFSPDSQLALTISEARHKGLTTNQRIQIWDTRTGSLLTTLTHSDEIFRAAFSANSEYILCAPLNEHVVYIWDARHGTIISRLSHTSSLTSGSPPQSTADVSTIVSTTQKIGHIWNQPLSPSPQEIKFVNDSFITKVAISPDGTLIGVIDGTQIARVWRLSDGKFITELRGHSGPLTDITFSPDSAYIVTASLDETVRIWDIRINASIVKRGHATLREGDGISLGETTSNISVVDISYARRLIQVNRNAQVVIMGKVDFEALSAYDVVQHLQPSAGPVSSHVEPGDVIVMRTAGGNYAKIHILKMDAELTVQWIAYVIDSISPVRPLSSTSIQLTVP